MPYVKQSDREKLELELKDILSKLEKIPDDSIEGSLNYIFTELLSSLKRNNGKWRYCYLNRAIGVLECCKLELYRRAASPYEDECIKNNGDVEIYK